MKLIYAALLFALIGCQPALANDVCTDRTRLVDFLSDKYKEGPRAMGLISRSGVMEIYVSAKGSWTIVATSSKGMTCVIAAGDNWEEIEPHFMAGDPS